MSGDMKNDSPVKAASSDHDERAETGDWGYWERQWQKLTKNTGSTLYTAERPATITEFYQRGYFEDLWGMMGDRAVGSRYLELGSGRGTTSMYLSAKGCDVTMVDIAPSAFELARENFQFFNLPQPNFVAADVRDTGLPSESWDCIYNIGLLEHFEEPLPILKEAYRLLKPNGVFFMVIVPEIPDTNGLFLKLLFNPLATSVRYVKRYMARALRKDASRKQSKTIRTDFNCKQYLSWINELTQDADCCYYNPYHKLYKNPWLERNVNMTIYRWDYERRKKRGVSPLFQSGSRLAQCYLLTARKPAP